MKHIDINTLAETISQDLKREFADYSGVFTFGSRTRDDAQEFSDYDLVFVFEHEPDWRQKEKAREIVYLKELEFDVVIDSHFYSRIDIEHFRTPFREAVCTEGTYHAVR